MALTAESHTLRVRRESYRDRPSGRPAIYPIGRLLRRRTRIFTIICIRLGKAEDGAPRPI